MTRHIKNTEPGHESFRAVAIGTSAGGIEALNYLLPSIPEDCNMSFFVVQHISAESDSSFIRLMRDRCSMIVREACNTDKIEPGTIYFAPPDYHLLVEKDKTLSLSKEEKINYSRPSIDLLFETAAEAFTEMLTGILLTGVNRDGSSGLKRIADLGGRTIVQSPEDAAFSEMPASALKILKPDMVITLKEIAAFLGRCD
ncbi:MAG TPA: chemotaxis protein CheB [Bacteroidales bacterium]|nr:chemotaxis protein CheB [Bacteroidales bacterium]